MAPHLLPAPLTERTLHLCVDMQNIFGPGGPWETPWLPRVLPAVRAIAERFPERTIFTRFMTPEHPQQLPGCWQRYYTKWIETTRPRIDPALLDLVAPLRELAPPARVIDKTRYSAFAESPLLALLRQRAADGLIVTGSETDVCVMATVLDAVDLGLRVILVRDAVCSSSDAGHDALLALFRRRYSEQVETTDAQTILELWPQRS